MTTAQQVIDSARYDLLDEKDTQYSDALLLDYLNRGLRPLCVALASFNSDWTNTQETLTLTSGASVTALPDYFISDIYTEIEGNPADKYSVSYIRAELRESTPGLPNKFALSGTNMMFNTEADADYAVTLEYNVGQAALTLASNMPFNDEFNDVLRQFIVILGKNRNKYSVLADAALQDFFYDAVLAKVVARNYSPNSVKTDF
jgi:hypothetical protein